MNNRGKPLTILEKLKNRLIYLSTMLKDCPLEDKHNLRTMINDSWGCIYKELARSIDNPLDEDEFITAHLSVFREPPLKQGYYVFTKEMAEVKLFEMFCNKAEKYPICKDSEEKEDAVSYDKIKDYALAISKFAITWQKINNTDDDLIQKIFKLNSSLPMKIFLCALNEKKTTEENFQTALRFTEKILFRNAIFVFTMDERIFSEFARDLYAGEPYEAVVNELRAKVDSVQITTQTLELVANNFAGLYEYERGNKGFHRWQGLKYLLFEYEQFLKVENKE